LEYLDVAARKILRFDLKETVCEGVDWIHMAPGKVQ